ncbi:hypothetical protein EST38_g12455 [Candolleomyces aberdarensis]|uniref:Uncharacterized protein n=1 Tax=Candolleomyces aberdarensis TaxID=2316362 RepID=A0A4Q2D356_9AGAR|nr:hypothetical protein EST38_g12455 [Candolleomyces aberdarensis]
MNTQPWTPYGPDPAHPVAGGSYPSGYYGTTGPSFSTPVAQGYGAPMSLSNSPFDQGYGAPQPSYSRPVAQGYGAPEPSCSPPAAQGDGTPEPSSSSPVPQDHPYSQSSEEPTLGARVAQTEGKIELTINNYYGLRENSVNIGPGGVFKDYKTKKVCLEDCLREAIQRAEDGRLSPEQAGQIVAIVKQRLAEISEV